MARRIVVALGTRPEAIKLAPVVHALRAEPAFDTRLISTGQHRELVAGALRAFNLEPDADLAIMTRTQTLTDITVRALQGMERLLADERPEFLLVQGDTTTVMAAALVGFYHKVPVGHVEAGLRSGDRFRPFPEEVNRRVVSAVADLHFAPTTVAVEALRREGIRDAHILLTGNTVIDALRYVQQHAPKSLPGDLADLSNGAQRIVLVTAHRRESWGGDLENICRALADIAAARTDVVLVVAVHPNPVVREGVERVLGGQARVRLIPPPDYATFVRLMERSHLIITDSGGIQEEAPAVGVPVLVTREVTERPEAIAAGAARLVGVGRERIVTEALRILDDPAEWQRMRPGVSPYGDGRAAERIRDALRHFFGLTPNTPAPFIPPAVAEAR